MNNTLGDSLSEDIKSKLTSGIVAPGAVLKCYVDDAGKEKRMLILALSDDRVMAATFYFNSENNLNVNFDPKIHLLQMPFSSKNREYLTKDCYLDCARIKEKSISWLRSELHKSPKAYIGSMSSRDLELVKMTVANSGLLSNKQLKRFDLYKYKRSSN